MGVGTRDGMNGFRNYIMDDMTEFFLIYIFFQERNVFNYSIPYNIIVMCHVTNNICIKFIEY